MRYRPFAPPVLAAIGSSDVAAGAAAPAWFAGDARTLDLTGWADHPGAARYDRMSRASPMGMDSNLIIGQQRSLVIPHALRPMSDTAPKHAGFDRAAAAILGSMITLIVALSFVLLEASVETNPEHAPMTAVAELANTP